MTDRRSISKCRQLLGQAVPDPAEIGRLVRAAHEEGSFTEFCDAVGLHIRKAYDLVAIADAVDHGLLARNTVQEIGWSKSRLIATQARTKRQAQKALTFARNQTLPAVPAFLRAEGSSGPLVTKCFHVTPEDGTVRRSAARGLVCAPAGSTIGRRL